MVEAGGPAARSLVASLFGRSREATVIGVTGAPGVGKSTLVDRLASEWRRERVRVAILAVDPTSPFTGGAILGDRIRMQTHSGDEGVYLRSMATRGHLGGLAHATADAAVVVAASGAGVVLIETVGVGQGEIDIARTADACLVVTVPGTGDDVQALKAGIMEIGDVFVVNKADRPGADRAAAQITSTLQLEARDDGVYPAVLTAEAASGTRINDVHEAVKAFLVTGGNRQQRLRMRADVRLRQALTERFLEQVDSATGARRVVVDAVERIATGDVDPYTAAALVMEQMEQTQ